MYLMNELAIGWFSIAEFEVLSTTYDFLMAEHGTLQTYVASVASDVATIARCLVV